MGRADCRVCGRPIDGDSAAVGGFGDPESFAYIPFVEDLRSSGFRLTHPACFAIERGVGALVDLIHEHDRMERTGFWKMVREIEDLKRQLADRDPSG
jgi:hypothetical protein